MSLRLPAPFASVAYPPQEVFYRETLQPHGIWCVLVPGVKDEHASYTIVGQDHPMQRQAAIVLELLNEA